MIRHTLDAATLNRGRTRTVYGWGKNTHGCLAVDPDETPVLHDPLELEYFRHHGIEKISTGADHSLVLSLVGTRTCLYAFGSNVYGQLGIDSTSSSFHAPRHLSFFRQVRVAQIAAGARYSMALTGAYALD